MESFIKNLERAELEPEERIFFGNVILNIVAV